jgi:SAM-dependent methyltransferase
VLAREQAPRAALGQWFTAAPVARLAVAAAGAIDARTRVVDPTCGDGAFLAAAHAAGARRLVGIDIDADAAAAARARLPAARIVVGDALGGAASEWAALAGRRAGFDVVVGNPPYVRAGSVDPRVKRARADVLAADWPELPRAEIDAIARLADVAATCLLRALRLCAPGGRLALVVSTALLDADAAAPLWRAVERVACVRALIAAPGERWFDDAAVNPMIVVAERRAAGAGARSTPRLVRLTAPTAVAAEACARARGELAALAAYAELRDGGDAPAAWGPALRASSAWFAWRAAAGDALVPLGELADVRRGLTTGANRVFYVKRAEAAELRLERAYLAPVVRSPFNGSPAAIAVTPDDSPLVALALPPDPRVLRRAPRIAAWLARHEEAAARTSVRRRDPWWSLPAHPARLFLAKAYGPRFVQRLADVPMLADQRVYALAPRAGVDLAALAAVLNALPTALALESLGRASMGYGAVEHTVADALALPVLDVRRADSRTRGALQAALEAMARRLVLHVRDEHARADRAALDAAALAIVPRGAAEMCAEMWRALLASVALRDRYLLPTV